MQENTNEILNLEERGLLFNDEDSMLFVMNPSNMYGNTNGKNVYVLIVVDADDHEDSRIELWMADNPDEAERLIRDAWVDDDETREEWFGEQWGSTILLNDNPIAIKPSLTSKKSENDKKS